MKNAFLFILVIFTCVGIFAQQPVVAVAPFDAVSGISTTDANMITRVFTIRLGNTQRVAFVDRTIVERVLQEHRFQLSDWSNAQKTAELGRALNADWIVRGELEQFGRNILITVQFYNIQTFRFMGGADLLLANANEALERMDPLVNKLIEAIASAQAATVRRTYNIGDRGPGGGIVFFADGGQYMECSGELGSTSKWDVDTVIMNYQGGGFKDWRLPNLRELELMRTNLRNRNLGGFRDEAYYWSSNIYWNSTTIREGRRFSDGNTGWGFSLGNLRAVRAFSQ